MPAWTPWVDPGAIRDRKIAALGPEARALHEALEGCVNLAERVVLVRSTKYGLTGLGEYLRHSKADRQQMREAARALREVGMSIEAQMCEIAATMKRKPPPDFDARQKPEKRKPRTRTVPKHQSTKA
jgi:hypothetical protein